MAKWKVRLVRTFENSFNNVDSTTPFSSLRFAEHPFVVLLSILSSFCWASFRRIAELWQVEVTNPVSEVLSALPLLLGFSELLWLQHCINAHAIYHIRWQSDHSSKYRFISDQHTTAKRQYALESSRRHRREKTLTKSFFKFLFLTSPAAQKPIEVLCQTALECEHHRVWYIQSSGHFIILQLQRHSCGLVQGCPTMIVSKKSRFDIRNHAWTIPGDSFLKLFDEIRMKRVWHFTVRIWLEL